QRRLHPATGDGPARLARRAGGPGLPLPLDRRAVLPLVQMCAAVPALVWRVAVRRDDAGIRCLDVLAAWTNQKPNKRVFEFICHYFMGWLQEAELQRHLEKLLQPKRLKPG